MQCVQQIDDVPICLGLLWSVGGVAEHTLQRASDLTLDTIRYVVRETPLPD